MDIVLGIVAVLLLGGLGSSRSRHAISEKIAELRETRRLRRKYDF